MPLLVDTWNVLHATGDLPEDAAWLDLLTLGRLLTTSRYRQESTELVCDGAPSPTTAAARAALRDSVTVTCTGPTVEADTMIESRIDAHPSPRSLIVVSSDRRIRRAARRRRARSITSQTFIHQLLADASRPTGPRRPMPEVPLGGQDVDAWVRAFDLDQELLGIVGTEPTASPRQTPDQKPAPASDSSLHDSLEAMQSDPLLREAMQMWPARLRWEDLDMSRWIDDPAQGDRRG